MNITLIQLGDNFISPYGIGIRKLNHSDGVVYCLDFGDRSGYMVFSENEFKEFIKVNKIKIHKLK